jgi:hypothetical protein
VERVETQYQEEILRRTWVRRFHIPICRCTQCAKGDTRCKRLMHWVPPPYRLGQRR